MYGALTIPAPGSPLAVRPMIADLTRARGLTWKALHQEAADTRDYPRRAVAAVREIARRTR